MAGSINDESAPNGIGNSEFITKDVAAQVKAYRRMPISFGPSPSPRQDFEGNSHQTGGSTFVTTTIKFKTSRALLSRLLPTPAYSLEGKGAFAYASYATTTLDKLDWLGGKGYHYLGFYIHNVQYEKRDGSILKGDYLAVMWEDLTDPILTGRDEVGFPKLYSEIHLDETDTSWTMEASWRSATYITLQLHSPQPGELPAPNSNDGVFVYKYIPATGMRDCADVEYPVCAPVEPGRNIKEFKTTSDCSIRVHSHNQKALPTLHHIVSRLEELPVHEIELGSIASGTGVDDVSTAYRIE